MTAQSTRRWLLLGGGVVAVVAIALISRGDGGASDPGAVGGSVSVATDPAGSRATDDGTIATSATSATTGGASTSVPSTANGVANPAPGSATTSGPAVATTTRPAVVATTSPGVTVATASNSPATIKPATVTVAATLPTAGPATSSPTLRLFFQKVATGTCDAGHHFSWSVNLLSSLTPTADPAPDRIVQDPANPRGWDVFWTETYAGEFTSPLTVISAGGESFTVPPGEAAQPANCT